MKRFLIAAVVTLTFGAPAMAQSYGGYGGQPYQGGSHSRSDNGPSYGEFGDSYGHGLGYAHNDRSYNDRQYNDHGYKARVARHEWREERQHERRERFERRGGNGYYGY